MHTIYMYLLATLSIACLLFHIYHHPSAIGVSNWVWITISCCFQQVWSLREEVDHCIFSEWIRWLVWYCCLLLALLNSRQAVEPSIRFRSVTCDWHYWDTVHLQSLNGFPFQWKDLLSYTYNICTWLQSTYTNTLNRLYFITLMHEL